jgi:hypothetical protein
MKNAEAIKKACDRMPEAKFLGIKQDARAGSGIQVKFDSWHYPVTINTQTGECKFDNYNGRWGSEKLLDQLKQGYGVEAARMQAESENREMEEMRLDDGSIKCVIPLGGEGFEFSDEGGGGGSGWDV